MLRCYPAAKFDSHQQPVEDDIHVVKNNEPTLPLRSREDKASEESTEGESRISKRDEHTQSRTVDDKEDDLSQKEDGPFRTDENYKLQDAGMEGFPDPSMDMNQMMQFANANGMTGFNPMMGKFFCLASPPDCLVAQLLTNR